MSFLTDRESRFVKRIFEEYYRENANSVYVPSKIEKREFGYFTFEQKVMVRHISFKGSNELFETIKKVVPLHIYHSAAYYEYPSAPMEEKVWMGAELIFDIDADHIETLCKKEHDFSLCMDCLSILPSESKQCGKCGSTKINKIDWVCERCIESAKLEVQKLLEFLEVDFGIPSSRIALSFSGNRGFHVVVSDEDVFKMDQMARKEVVDYITGNGLDPLLQGLIVRRGSIISMPDYTESGWRGRIVRSIIEIVRDLEKPEISSWIIKELGSKMYNRLLKAKEDLLMGLLHGSWKDLKPRMVIDLAELAVKRASAAIDTVVTSDVHRLLRLPNTLNGKTGMVALRLSLDDLESFDPFVDAIVLPSDLCEVKVFGMPRIKVNGMEFGPYTNEVVKLPIYLAVMLMAKGLAKLASAE